MAQATQASPIWARTWPIVLVLAFASVLPQGFAQKTGQLIILDAGFDVGFQQVRGAPPDNAFFSFHYRDLSPTQPVQSATFVDRHFVVVHLEWKDGKAPEGWGASFSLDRSVLLSGEGGSGQLSVNHDVGTLQSFVEGTLVMELMSEISGQKDARQLPFAVMIAPSPVGKLELLPQNPEKVRPYQPFTFQVQIRNVDKYPAEFQVSVDVLPGDGIDPQDVPVSGTGTYHLEAGQERTIPIQVIAPRAKFWYNSVSMVIQCKIQPAGGGALDTRTYILTLDGFYVSENWYPLFLALLAQLLLLIFLLVYAKRSYERKYLGRPIPPWEIPEEKAALDRLKQEDPRAFYVTRYFLMEEEYRSALLWFYAYKKISKRQLKAEARSYELHQAATELAAAPTQRYEKAFARLERRYLKRIERRKAWVQRKIEKVQARLERTHEKDYDEEYEKWEERVAKLRAKHDRPHLKAKAAWEKETKKVIERWEKPFKKEKEKYEKALTAALEKYEKQVKKKDKAAWKAWHEAMQDWEVEKRVRQKEGRELPPRPELVSTVLGPPQLPPPFVAPPKPELPPEPKPDPHLELPPEPTKEVPALSASKYAKKARRIERKGARKIRVLEQELARALLKLDRKQNAGTAAIARKRSQIELEAQAALRPTFVDRVLRRTPEQTERRHHVAFVKGRTHERIEEAEERAENAVEHVRIEGERREAELESKIIQAEVRFKRAQGAGAPEEAAQALRSQSVLKSQLADLRKENRAKAAETQEEARRRLKTEVAAIQEEEKAQLERERAAGSKASAAAAPSQP